MDSERISDIGVRMDIGRTNVGDDTSSNHDVHEIEREDAPDTVVMALAEERRAIIERIPFLRRTAGQHGGHLDATGERTAMAALLEKARTRLAELNAQLGPDTCFMDV